MAQLHVWLSNRLADTCAEHYNWLGELTGHMALQHNLDITRGGESIQTGPKGTDTVSWSGSMSNYPNS